MSLHDPITFAQIVRGMIDIQKHEGILFETIICTLAYIAHQVGCPSAGMLQINNGFRAEAVSVLSPAFI
jgi:hypothetical protein